MTHRGYPPASHRPSAGRRWRSKLLNVLSCSVSAPSTVDAHVHRRTHTGPGVRPARGRSSRLLSVVRREHSRPLPPRFPRSVTCFTVHAGRICSWLSSNRRRAPTSPRRAHPGPPRARQPPWMVPDRDGPPMQSRYRCCRSA
ncbi:hypothetical protein K525DRAFT_198233 [Schizophyllum commune Loenen D]|nr:hypothetical protein K525DRAFT_198233 [Schizophyllum commune Loenen D]